MCAKIIYMGLGDIFVAQLLIISISQSIITTALFGIDNFGMSCNRSEYLDPSLMSCQLCPVNVSMVASSDGFSCICEENSVPIGPGRCKKCNATEVVSADGAACVPRRCQNTSGRFICRKCPADYISVTQNLDGSPSKEVLCVKCARGYKPHNNVCVKCPACVCAKNEVAVRGVCLPKRYVNERPKYDGKIHPTALLEFLKHEYLCTKMDLSACRALAHDCVKNFYTADVAGPCRLWIQSKMALPKGLPELIITNSNEMKPDEFILGRGQDSIGLALAVYTTNGGMKLLKSGEEKPYKCFLPLKIRIGFDMVYHCNMNITEIISLDNNSTFSVYLNKSGSLKQLPIVMQKPDGYYVKRETWSSQHFRRFFLVDNFIGINNSTNVVYLRTLLVRIVVERDKYQSSALRVQVRLEARYSSKSYNTQILGTELRVQNEMPSAGILRGLEVWGGVLGSLLSLYAVIQWRGEMRRGGLHFSLIPHVAGCLSDALYFAVWFSTLHALAAEAGALGMTLPLSHFEEPVIKAFIYTTISLKVLKVAWINWKQCSCDIFILDWSEYHSSTKDALSITNKTDWRSMTLAKEWNTLQTKRRAPPIYTVVLTLITLQLISPWQNHIQQSPGYKWATVGIAWWSSYAAVLVSRWILYKIVSSAPASFTKLCKAVGLSLLVFEDEHYAHYVHGRNDDSKDLRLMAGPLAMCRVVLASQLRIVYNQLSSSRLANVEGLTKQAILSRLLAAFFDRALDGLNWVASERTLLERLLNVELTERESGTTSVLLYDPEEITPSCVALTWWGNEWSLGSLDAMLFGCITFATDDPLIAALVAVTIWQAMKHTRLWFGRRNQRKKTNIDTLAYY